MSIPKSRAISVEVPAPRRNDWWTWPGSNRRPPACKAGALPAELHAHRRSDLHSKAFAPIPKSVPSLLRHHCTKTVPKPPSTETDCAWLTSISLARRLSFSRASRFMANFIWEYFLNTSEFPCRRSWTTHSSATPPALRRVAYVERRS